MSVLKGEGIVPILFGSTSISVGSLTHTGYLARPDLAGEWPTVVVIPSAWGVTGAMKDVTRRLARQGFAAICPDLFAGNRPGRSAPRSEAIRLTRAMSEARVRRGPWGFILNPRDRLLAEILPEDAPSLAVATLSDLVTKLNAERIADTGRARPHA